MVFDDENQPARNTRSGDDDMPMFYIGVVAQITGTHPQTLRNYERIGLVRPERSQGSEMCIRDSRGGDRRRVIGEANGREPRRLASRDRGRVIA